MGLQKQFQCQIKNIRFATITSDVRWKPAMALCMSEKLESGLVGVTEEGNNCSIVVDFLGGGCVQTQSNTSACKTIGRSENISLSVTSWCWDM